MRNTNKRLSIILLSFLLVNTHLVLMCYGVQEINQSARVLDLSNQNLFTLPPIPQSVETLILDDNHIREFPESICELPRLRKLSLRNNSLKILPSSIKQLRSLVELDLRGNDISEFPSELWELNTLSILRLEHSDQGWGDDSQPKLNFRDISKLKNLRELHVVHYYFVDKQFDSIQELTQLRKLKLKRNNFKPIPAAITSLMNLESLEIIDNGHGIPLDIGRLQKLTLFRIRRSSPWTIPKEQFVVPFSIGDLTELETLDLGQFRTEKFPSSISRLRSLKEMTIAEVGPKIDVTEIWKLDQLTSLTIEVVAEPYLLPREIGNLKSLEKLCLKESGVRIIPEEIGRLRRLKSLDISSSFNGVVLPESFASLPNLTELKMSDWGDVRTSPTFPTVVTKLKHLNSLDISGGVFRSLPDEFWELPLAKLVMSTPPVDVLYPRYFRFALTENIGRLSGLIHLDISGFKGPISEDAIREIGKLQHLKYLDISRLQEKKGLGLGEEFTNLEGLLWGTKHGGLTRLESLKCSENMIKAIPAEIGRLKELRHLILGKSWSLESISPEIGPLKKLETLEIRICEKLVKLPDEIGNLTNLQTFSCEYGSLMSLPDSFGQLINLRSLILGNQKLESLPSGFGELRELTSLRLSENKLTSLPDSFGQLVQLQNLQIQENDLEFLPSSFVNLKRLGILGISENRLKSLPAGIGNLRELTELNLRGSKIETWPPDISRLANLKRLNLSGQGLESIPDSIGKLSKLEYLNLCSNRLKKIPETVGNCRALVVIGLGGNSLTDLPPTLKALTNLETIDLAGNQFGNRLPKVLSQISNLKQIWVNDDVLKEDLLSPQELGSTRLKKFRTYYNEVYRLDQYVISPPVHPRSQPGDNQLSLPKFEPGLGPSERSIAKIAEETSFAEGKFYRYDRNEKGKFILRVAHFHKIPDGYAEWKKIFEMRGIAVVFNQFIPLPKYEVRDRYVNFVRNDSLKKTVVSFGHSYVPFESDNRSEDFSINLDKAKARKERYIPKNVAFIFEGGRRFPAFSVYDHANFYMDQEFSFLNLKHRAKRGAYSADRARDLTRRDYFDDTSPPLFSFFAPEGQTPWDAFDEVKDREVYANSRRSSAAK